MRDTDSQRGKVYAWERSLPGFGTPIKLDACRELLGEVKCSPIFTKRAA